MDAPRTADHVDRDDSLPRSDSSARAARWLVSGVLGLAVLGSAGCATTGTAAVTQQVGPAVVLDGPKASSAKPPSTRSSAKASAGGRAAEVSEEKASKPTSKDGGVKKVTPASPQSVNSPVTPPSAPTP